MEIKIEHNPNNKNEKLYPYFAETPTGVIVFCSQNSYTYLDDGDTYNLSGEGYKESELTRLPSGTKVTLTQP